MKFIPMYTVSYKGTFHRAGEAFEIDAKDRKEMERHGVVGEGNPTVPPVLTEKTEPPAVDDKPTRKGRPKKVSE